MKKIAKPEFFSDGTQVKILDFQVRSIDNKIMRLGINIQKIKEVVELKELQSLPDSYSPFIGLYNLRETPVPVIYLGALLGKVKNKPSDLDYESFFPKSSRIMITEFQRMLIGFVIDKTGRIITLPNSEVKAVPEAIDFTSDRIFNGIIRDGDEFINLLDIELILDSLKIDLGYEKMDSFDVTFRDRKVLLVEDSKLFQAKLKKFFEKLKMKVVLAEDGIEGIEKLKEHNFNFDLIFTDIEMPLLNGIGMVRKIKNMPQADHIPIIFNTSISNPGLVDDIRRENLGEYFVKYDEEEIVKAIFNTLEMAQKRAS